MAKHRTHSVEFKRQVSQEYLAGETLHGLSNRHDISRQLIRVWVEKYQAGALDEDAAAADMLQTYEARIAALERLVGKQALELEFLKGALRPGPVPSSGSMSAIARPKGISVAEGCRVMGLARSTFYENPAQSGDDTAIVESMAAICEEFEHYGWRRVRAALRQQGLIVNHKKIRRLMRQHDLQPKIRRRFIATTDSNHDHPIFPNLAAGVVPDGPDQLWVADITYVVVIGGFVYVAIVLDAWSRRVVSYAISRSIDARLTLAALSVAIERREPPPGCLHHSDRGSQYAAGAYRQFLAANGFVGSTGRRGNPYDNAKAESFMKTLKVEGVYPMEFETITDVAEHLPRFIDEIYNGRRLHSAPGYRSPVHFEDQHVRRMVREAT